MPAPALLGQSFAPSHVATIGPTEFNLNADGGFTLTSTASGSIEDTNNNIGTDVVSLSFSSIPADATLNGFGLAVPLGYEFETEGLRDGSTVLNIVRVISAANGGVLFNLTGDVIQAGTDIIFKNGDPGPYQAIVPGVNLDLYDPVTFESLPTVLPLTFLACFATGTSLRTPEGEALVETVVQGDVLLTASGQLRNVIWTGRTRISVARHSDPASVAPVRIAAGAFGGRLPRRDLVLSPDHAVFVDGVLIPVKYLVDGRAITQGEVAEIVYHHVEFATHDAVLAEGLPVESYLDTGDRAAFEGGNVRQLHPSFSQRSREAGSFTEVVVSGPRLDAVRARLAAIDLVDISIVHRRHRAA